MLRLEKRNRKVSYDSVDFYVTSISCDPWYCDIYIIANRNNFL